MTEYLEKIIVSDAHASRDDDGRVFNWTAEAWSAERYAAYGVEYVRKDVSDAMVAAEREAAANRMRDSERTLRDWFAGQALAGMGDWTPWPEGEVSLNKDDPRIDLRSPEAQASRAQWAFAQADAMLAARDAEPRKEADDV